MTQSRAGHVFRLPDGPWDGKERARGRHRRRRRVKQSDEEVPNQGSSQPQPRFAFSFQDDLPFGSSLGAGTLRGLGSPCGDWTLVVRPEEPVVAILEALRCTEVPLGPRQQALHTIQLWLVSSGSSAGAATHQDAVAARAFLAATGLAAFVVGALQAEDARATDGAVACLVAVMDSVLRSCSAERRYLQQRAFAAQGAAPLTPCSGNASAPESVGPLGVYLVAALRLRQEGAVGLLCALLAKRPAHSGSDGGSSISNDNDGGQILRARALALLLWLAGASPEDEIAVRDELIQQCAASEAVWFGLLGAACDLLTLDSSGGPSGGSGRDADDCSRGETSLTQMANDAPQQLVLVLVQSPPTRALIFTVFKSCLQSPDTEITTALSLLCSAAGVAVCGRAVEALAEDAEAAAAGSAGSAAVARLQSAAAAFLRALIKVFDVVPMGTSQADLVELRWPARLVQILLERQRAEPAHDLSDSEETDGPWSGSSGSGSGGGGGGSGSLRADLGSGSLVQLLHLPPKKGGADALEVLLAWSDAAGHGDGRDGADVAVDPAWDCLLQSADEYVARQGRSVSAVRFTQLFSVCTDVIKRLPEAVAAMLSVPTSSSPLPQPQSDFAAFGTEAPTNAGAGRGLLEAALALLRYEGDSSSGVLLFYAAELVGAVLSGATRDSAGAAAKLASELIPELVVRAVGVAEAAGGRGGDGGAGSYAGSYARLAPLLRCLVYCLRHAALREDSLPAGASMDRLAEALTASLAALPPSCSLTPQFRPDARAQYCMSVTLAAQLLGENGLGRCCRASDTACKSGSGATGPGASQPCPSIMPQRDLSYRHALLRLAAATLRAALREESARAGADAGRSADVSCELSSAQDAVFLDEAAAVATAQALLQCCTAVEPVVVALLPSQPPNPAALQCLMETLECFVADFKQSMPQGCAGECAVALEKAEGLLAQYDKALRQRGWAATHAQGPRSQHVATGSLHEACRDGRLDCVVEALSALDRPSACEAMDEAGQLPIHIASGCGHREILAQLLAAGSRLEASNKDGFTSLHLACRFGRMEVVTHLLEAAGKQTKALVEMQTKNGCTALHAAAAHDSAAADIVKLLLQADANREARTEDGDTPLHVACGSGGSNVVRALLAAGADLMAVNASQSTPLHTACAAGRRLAVRELLDAGADMSAGDKDGNTPLHVAVSAGQKLVVEVLLRAGASISIQNRNRKRPTDLPDKGSSIRALLAAHQPLSPMPKRRQQQQQKPRTPPSPQSPQSPLGPRPTAVLSPHIFAATAGLNLNDDVDVSRGSPLAGCDYAGKVPTTARQKENRPGRALF